MPQQKRIIHQAGTVTLILLFGLLIGLGCVTEVQAPAVSIHAGASGKIYPPPQLYGSWSSEGRRIIFQPPPDPAIVIASFRQQSSFDIAAMRRNASGSITFELAPLDRGLPQNRTFFPPTDNTLIEVENDTRITWQRSR